MEGPRPGRGLPVLRRPRRLRRAGVRPETLDHVLPQGTARRRPGGRGGKGGGEGQGVPRRVRGRREDEKRGVRDLLVVPHEGRDRKSERGGGSSEVALPGAACAPATRTGGAASPTPPSRISEGGEGGSSRPKPPVAAPPPPPPAAKVIDRLVVRVNFDTDKALIRKADTAELRKAIEFVKKYPGHNVTVEGHTDNVGKDKHNQALSERRAAAVKKHLVENGATSGDRIKAVGVGKTRPVADKSTG